MTILLLNIAEITLTIGVMAALLIPIFSTLGKRFTAKCRYIVWALVMLRLCVPIGFSVFSPVFDLTLPEEIVTERTGEAVSETINGVSEETSKQVDRLPVTPSVDAQGSVTPGDVPHIQDGNISAAPDTFEGEVPSPVIRDEEEFDGTAVEQTVIDTSKLIETAGIVWLTGAAIFFAIRLGNYLVYSIKLRHSTKLAEPDEETAGIYEKLMSEMGLKRAPVLKVCTEPVSPMLFGYFKKIIIIPDMTYDREHIGGILRHELTHYRRGDTWVKLMCCAAQAVHWFNPMVHIAAARCVAEMELSCDEAVLRGLEEEERLSYGEAMLQIVRRSMKARASGLTTSFNPRRSAVKERFMNIIDMRKKRRGVLIISIVALLCIVAGTIIGCNVGVVENNSASELPPYVQDAIRAYNGLTSEDEITDEMLDAVTSIQLKYIGKADGGFYIDAAVNESNFYAYFSGYIAKDRFEKEYNLKAEAFKNAEGYDSTPYVYTGTRHTKFMYESILPEDNRSEAENTRSLIQYPILEEIGAMYVVNDEMAAEELRLVFKFIEDAIDGDCKITASTNTLDLSSLSALPNLEYVDRPENVTVENYPVTMDREKSTDELVYVEDDGGIVVVEYIGEGGDVVIPDTIEGKSVIKIGDKAFYKNKNVVSLKLPDTITEIGTEAFYQCKKLKNIDLPESLDTIRDYAFGHCYNMKELSLPKNLNWLGNNAFVACGIEKVNIPASIEAWGVYVFYNSNLTTVELEAGLKEIGHEAFWQTQLKSVTLPEGIEKIGIGAFSQTNIEEVVFPDSIKKIGAAAFSGCKSLERIILNEGLESIGDGVVSGTAITEIIIPSTVVEVTDQSLDKAENLEKVIFAGNAPETFVKYTNNNEQEKTWGANFTVYYNEDAEGFTSPMWYGYKAVKIGHEDEMKYYGDFGYTNTEDGGVVIYEYTGEIHRCRDAYFTDEDEYLGRFTVTFDDWNDNYKLSNYSVRLCDDGCDDIIESMNVALSGYARVCSVKQIGEYEAGDVWKYPTKVFNSDIPQAMIDNEPEGIDSPAFDIMKRNYSYMMILQDDRYLVLSIRPVDTTIEAPENEQEIVDALAGRAVVTLSFDEEDDG